MMMIKSNLLITALLLGLISFAQKPVDVVKASLKAYNKGDIETFMSYFSEDVEMKNFNDSEIRAKGKEEIRAIYEPYFKASPNLHSKIVDRIVFDNKVMDHEYITGAMGKNEAFEIVVIYEIENDKIIRMTAVRAKQ